MTHARLTVHFRSAGFWFFALTVLFANGWMVQNHSDWAGGPAPEWPLAFDLLVLLPGLYWYVNRRQGRSALIGALALFGVGILAGSWLLPDESRNLWPWLESLRYLAIGAVVLMQASLIVLMLREVIRTRHGRNLELAIDSAITRRYGSHSLIANALRLEGRLWLYALLRRPIRQPFPGQQHFRYDRQQGNASNQLGFLVLIGAEIPIMHGLLHLFAGPVVATVMSVLSVYGFLFMLADYRASLHRPISLDGERLLIRYGLTGDVAVPLARIAGIEPTRATPRRAAGRLRFVGMGAANVRLDLHPDTRLPGLFGARGVHEIHLGVDEPGRFVAAVQAACAAAKFNPDISAGMMTP